MSRQYRDRYRAPSRYRGLLNKWLDTCHVRDEHGGPVHLTPHQWRHTFACRLINRDVPQEVVRVLLDHSSTQMTAHYAKLTDQTVRRRWEQATRVNISGERVTIDPDGPLGQAQWAKTRYGIATQTLPNGYCGLPVQRQCPHANCVLTEQRNVFAVQKPRRVTPQVRLVPGMSCSAGAGPAESGHLMPNRSPTSSSVLLVGISHNRPATFVQPP